MGNDVTTTAWLAIARAVHIGACLALLGVWSFDGLIVGTAATRFDYLGQAWTRIARGMIVVSLPAALVSGAAWFALVVVRMSALPIQEALRIEPMRLVWFETQFGSLWRLRLLFLSGTIIATLVRRGMQSHDWARAGAWWVMILCNAALVGSLAWAGHGQTGRFTQLHLAADVVHLLTAALWPLGLLPFTLLLLALRRTAEAGRWDAIALLTRRFSALSLASVGMLAGTGLVNACCLLHSPADLIASAYGRLLLTKIMLFLLATGLGAMNLFYLKPRLLGDVRFDPSQRASPARWLQINATAELFLAALVTLIVALLGVLPPMSR